MLEIILALIFWITRQLRCTVLRPKTTTSPTGLNARNFTSPDILGYGQLRCTVLRPITATSPTGQNARNFTSPDILVYVTTKMYSA